MNRTRISPSPDARSTRLALGAGAFITVHEHWLDPGDASALQKALTGTIAWEQGTIRLFGREVAEPRLTAWFGDRDYVYSGRHLRSRPFPPTLDALRPDVEAACGSRLNSVLLNRYRDGRDSMGFHSDDEAELGSNPVIASLSLGAERRFLLRPKKLNGGTPLQLTLRHGMLLIMGGTCQHTFRHAVPKQASVQAERINLTFRNVVPVLTRGAPTARHE